MKETNFNFFGEDPRVKINNIKSRKDFVEKAIPVDLPSKNLPNSIKAEIETAFHMLAGSFYHYPLYDEGLIKILLTLEMAVKERLVQLGLSKDSIGSKTLSNCFDKLVELEPNKYNKDFLDHYRRERNYCSHRKHNYYGGYLLKRHYPNKCVS